MKKKNNPNSKLYLLILIGMLASLGPFVTDFYLPAFPELNAFFGTTATMTQLSLTFCMLGLAVGQIFIGSLSDKFGRKPPLVVSLILFIVSTAACMFAWSIESLIVFRFIQGLSGAGGVVISKSIAVDLYKGKELARFYILLSVVLAVAPVLSPVLGGVLLSFTDWKGIFFTLVLIELLLLLLLFPFKESLPKERRSTQKVMASFGNYTAIFRNKEFMSYVWIQSLAMAVMFAYIASSPFIFQEIYGLSPFRYSLCFGVNAISVMLGNLATTKIRTVERDYSLVPDPLSQWAAWLHLHFPCNCLSRSSRCSFGDSCFAWA